MRHRSLPRSLVTALVALAAFATAGVADGHHASFPAAEAKSTGSQHRGRPQLKLDRLEFPKAVPHGWYYRKQLRQILRREARRAEWGAGRGSTITYRFFVKDLGVVAMVERKDVSAYLMYKDHTRIGKVMVDKPRPL